MTQPSPDKAERFLNHLEPLQGVLAAFCRRCLCGPGESADALQSAIATAFRDFDLYAEGTNFRAWMFRFVSHEVLNRNRRHRRHKEVSLPSDLPATASSVDTDDAMDRLLEEPEYILDHCDDTLTEALLELPHLDRNILLLRAIGDFKYREIAEVLDVPIGTVMGLLSRSRERLRIRLKDYATSRGLLAQKKDS